MKDVARIAVLLFSAIFVVVVLSLWKKSDRESALKELEGSYEAVISQTEDEFYLGCASDRLVDLVEFAAVAARAGDVDVLDLTGAPNLESFNGIAAMGDLRSLIAIDCPKFTSAEGVSGHRKLREIVLTDSAAFTDTEAIRDLPNLDTVDFSGCVRLTEFKGENLPRLENLYFSRCQSLTGLDVTDFPKLKQLYLDGAAELQRLEGIGTLTKLTDFDVSNATSLTELQGLSSLESLIVLDIRNVELNSFDEIGRLPALRILRMGGQSGLTSLEPFAGLETLREIHLEACENFASLKGLPAGVSQYAGFTHCPELTSLSGIETAGNLEQLDLTGCENLTDISQISHLGGLTQLSLSRCRAVTEITPLLELEKLLIVMLGGSGVVPGSIEDLKPASKEVAFDFSMQ